MEEGVPNKSGLFCWRACMDWIVVMTGHFFLRCKLEIPHVMNEYEDGSTEE